MSGELFRKLVSELSSDLMEFVITRCPPEPAVAVGLGQRFVISETQICDDIGTVLGDVQVCDESPNSPGCIRYKLHQHGIVTAEFARRTNLPSESWFTFDDVTMRVWPQNYFVCEEIRARTVLPWYPAGQCVYTVDDVVDPVSALFLFQMLENLDDEIEGQAKQT